MNKLTASEDVLWVERPIIKMHDNPPESSQWEYRIMLPDWLAEWDVYGDWEVERFDSMRDNLKQGDILFDIGTEAGWQNIIYATYVGPENVVLIEPSHNMWANIMHIWQKNYPDKSPLACHYGLISDKTTSEWVLPKGLFPTEAEGQLTTQVSYKSLVSDGSRTPQIKLDDYCRITGIKPDALTIDVEGSELAVLSGAGDMLLNNDIKVWVSVHPDMAQETYGQDPQIIHDYMKLMGYEGTFLAKDHEEHWFFRKVA